VGVLKRLLFWDFRRASWQYDIIVVAILAFIFLTPRSIFRDYPRASNVVLLPAENGAQVYWIETDLLAGSSQEQWASKTAEILHKRFGRRFVVTRVEPMFDAENEVKCYHAYVKP